jgi:hypothetical protein
MLKETQTISYIQQVSHEWIEGAEEETVYAQATKSLRVVPMDIQHRPKVLQMFKTAHDLSQLYLILRTWRAMANRLSQYFISYSFGHRLRKGLHY